METRSRTWWEIRSSAVRAVYAIKREVAEIKKLAHEFAIQNDDPGFLNAVERGIAGEARTVAKRQQSMAARQAAGGGRA